MISVVSEGQNIALDNDVVSILPSDRDLVFKCYISDKDRAEIEVE
ncbi:hypothetical protein [uncultured Clostridium sp.]|nr:hypothetical protein [uncultured Clostridium sp.]